MSQPGLLKKAAQAFRELDAPFMLTGSLASSLQGEPRATHDVDVVVSITTAQIEGLLLAFPAPVFYLSRDAVEEAIAQGTMFNVLDTSEGDKLDCWLLTSDPFDQMRFSRRRPIEMDGVFIDVSSPEDTILMKLRWASMAGGSERQCRDALAVYHLQRPSLDMPYLESWIDRLGVRELWRQLVTGSEAKQ